MKTSTGSIGKILTSIAILITILSISNSCTKPTDNTYGTVGNTGGTGSKGGPGLNEVWIQSMAFNPNYISVASGTTITWTNKDAVAHTVTGNDGLPFDSGTIATNGTYSHTFTGVGLFQYHCTLHPSMVASVEVH